MNYIVESGGVCVQKSVTCAHLQTHKRFFCQFCQLETTAVLGQVENKLAFDEV